MEKIGKYELREVLGRGGMGIVYRAFDPVIDREVAVKVIQEKAVQSPELKARFVREARTAGKFSHENITVIHDMGEMDGKMFIVMEFLQGRDLRSIIDKREPLSLQDKLNYARQICKGLRYAHANGIVHRDIKPENVKVLTDGRIKIMDFGIAKPYVAEGTVVSEATDPVLTQMGMRIGTPWYMSPEQVKGAAVDKRSDIFSFGVLLYELLTYQKPFTGDDTTVLYKILHEEPEPIKLEESDLEVSLQRILSKCLAKNPDERYADCLLILRDIEKAPGGAGLPRIVPELLREAEELNRQQRLDEAQQKFTEVLEVDPENPVARASVERLTALKGELTIPAEPTAEHKTGEVISHFQIIQRISGGGMGVVYKAEDLTLRRTVALKFLAADWTRNPVAKKRFLKEAQAASALDHPNVCTIYEVGETAEGLLFLCMAFYEGEDLSTRIRQGPLPFEKALSIIEAVARGLGMAHEHGILHRDIKPGNILLTKGGEVKIVDFGIAKLSTGTQITRAGSVVGTLPYMSPEQIKGLELDPRADLWSLAVVLYQSLTGKVPFDDSSEAALFYSIINLDPEPVSAVRKDLPKRVDGFFTKALAKKPDDRYANAGEFIAALRALIADAPTTASPTGQRLEEVAALVDKGKAHMRRKEYDEAITRFEAALKISPRDQEIQALRAESLKKKPNAQKANALVREAEQRLADGKPRDARKSIQAALALDPEHPAAAQLLEKIVAATSAEDARLARPAGQPERRTPAAGSRTVMIAGGVAGLVVIAVVLWLLLRPSAPTTRPEQVATVADSSVIVASARDQMLVAKNSAGGVEAARWATALNSAAVEAERNAERARDGGLPSLARSLFEEAGNRYTTAAEEARKAKSASSSGVDELKSLVGEAHKGMLTAKRSADQAGAQQRSPALYAQASRLETEGDNASRSGSREDLLTARNAYATAREGYSRAATDARAEVAAKGQADAGLTGMRRAKQRVTGTEAEKQGSASYRKGLESESTGQQRYQQGDYNGARSAFEDAERSYGAAVSEIASARSQKPIAESKKDVVPDSPVKEPEKKDPAAKEREARDAAQRDVRRMLDDYRQIIEQGNLKSLTAMLGLNGEEQKRWELFFKLSEDRRVTTELVNVDVDGENCRASFRWKFGFQAGNTPQSQEGTKQWDLQLENGSWKIIKER